MADPSAAPPPPPPSPSLAAPDIDPSSEARRLKSLAEEKLRSSSLKSALKYARRARALCPSLDGADNMITAIKILRASPSDHYKILRLDPFSTPAAVKKQYKSLALALHPDRSSSPVPGAEDAFKRVADSFRFLSDRSRKRDFDLRLRLSLSSFAPASSSPVATFWTACTTCRLLHEFDRRYLAQRLICPVCRKTFLALETVETPVAAEPHSRATAARSRSHTRPRIPTGWTIPDPKRKPEPSASPESKKPRLAKEKTLAELQTELTGAKKKKGDNKHKAKGRNSRDLSLMKVEDSDFYDFDKDRTERSFTKGQVWAIYDDDDGMPRHYGLIDEVISSNPFRVKMSWLDNQSNGEDAMLLQEKAECRVSCGRFKVGRKVDIPSVNFFSHLVDCERAAKELYRMYPKKGTVWALYRDVNCGDEEGRSYDIAVCLTSYSEMYGSSIAYLEKIQGFKTIFRRREVGCHAVRWLEKDDVKLFSHRIPARKVSDLEDVDLSKGCWELDPASLPPDLLQIAWER